MAPPLCLALTRDRVTASYLALAEKIELQHNQVFTELERRGGHFEKRLDRLDTAVARLDERTSTAQQPSKKTEMNLTPNANPLTPDPEPNSRRNGKVARLPKATRANSHPPKMQTSVSQPIASAPESQHQLPAPGVIQSNPDQTGVIQTIKKFSPSITSCPPNSPGSPTPARSASFKKPSPPSSPPSPSTAAGPSEALPPGGGSVAKSTGV